MSRYVLLVAVLVLSFPPFTTPAVGSFVGTDVVLNVLYPNLAAAPTATLGPTTVTDPGVEFPHVLTASPSGNPVWTADVTSATIVVEHLAELNNLGCGSGTDPFNGFVFTFTGLPAAIASATLDPSSTLTPQAVWATADEVFVDYQCLGIIPNNASTVVNVTFVPTVPDHLECLRIKDPLKLRAVVDLDSPQFGLAPGCRVGRAKYFCVPAVKSVIAAVDGATNTPIVLLPIAGQELGDTICYGVRCPAAPIGERLVSDQFGSRTVKVSNSKLLCTPAVKGPPPVDP